MFLSSLLFFRIASYISMPAETDKFKELDVFAIGITKFSLATFDHKLLKPSLSDPITNAQGN